MGAAAPLAGARPPVRGRLLAAGPEEKQPPRPARRRRWEAGWAQVRELPAAPPMPPPLLLWSRSRCRRRSLRHVAAPCLR